MNRLTTITTGCMFLLVAMSWGQYAPNSSWPVSATEMTGVPQTDYQVHLDINTAAEVSAGRMAADGRDIRFSDSICGSTFFDYWIESGMNTPNTSIWVRIPSLAANSTFDFFLLSGDSSVVATSDFASTFPAAIVTGGTDVNLMAFNYNVGWLQVDAGDTLFVAPGFILEMYARKAIINGVIYGGGAGHQALTGLNPGVGPGGGISGSSSGASGGSYGGVGGTGGYDAGDPINTAPAAYGTTSAFDIDMGSSGGSASSAFGGDGGGAIQLKSEWIELNGTINMNGGSAQQPGSGQGGGGGAGGGIFLIAKNLDFVGAITANGGPGSTGTSSANDDGGGGGGGRIKMYYETAAMSGTSSVLGGAPGLYGTGAVPTAGGDGTTYSGMEPFIEVAVTVGAQSNIPNADPLPDLATLPNETGECSVTVGSPTATSSCGETIVGIPNVSFPITDLGTTIVTWTYTDGANSSTQQQTIIVNGPNTDVTQTGGTLTADLSGASYQWIDCATGAPVAGQTGQSFTPTIDGSYAVIVTNVCSDTSVCFPMTPSGLEEIQMVHFSVYPNPGESYIAVEWSAVGISEVEARLIDLQGRIAKTALLEAGTSEIGIAELQSGIYVLELRAGASRIASERILKK